MPPSQTNRVRDGYACCGCGLPNYHGLCPVCRGDEPAARDEGMPYPWPEQSFEDLARMGGLAEE